ncbi:exocyst complex component EXO70C1-like [Rutidosis leptorrhynchoides]|uniref:exocyst complex component EXO70C1-like n=1 Tax=Rutidosis leptorrhynchoides TaxID=125765 RepID=UPI003A99A5AE
MEKKCNAKSKNRKKGNAEVVDDQDESLLNIDHDQISIEIDNLMEQSSNDNEKSNSTRVPNTVDTFVRIIESKIKAYNALKSGSRFGNMMNDDEYFIEAIRRLSKLKVVLSENTSSFDNINKILQQAMLLMEEEFRALLLDLNASYEPIAKGATLESNNEDEFPGYSEENVNLMSKIALIMIDTGYKYECCQVYGTIRKDELMEQLKRYEFEKLNVEDVHKSKWASLEPDITRWVKLTNHCSNVLFPAEKKLGETIFSHHFSGVFINLIRDITTSLIEYANAVAMEKPKGKRLFKFIDMYEAIRSLRAVIEDSLSSDVEPDESSTLKSEISSAGDNIGEAVVNMFYDLKSNIQSDSNKTTVSGGGVHPLIRYVMNYIKCAVEEYQKTLEHIFRQYVKVGNEPISDVNNSSLSTQLLSVIDLLEANLETKSGLYKDLSLRYIFLMNNYRYILQVVKSTNEMKQLIGDNWCLRKSSDVRNYHKSYQRETWTKLLQWLTQEGVQVNGKPSRKRLKERFKNFNAMFDEIHKTQSGWVVSDDQLLSEIRVSISAVVSPAYRSFVGRYKPQFEGTKSIDKYIKYQPEDIESMIETLFEEDFKFFEFKRLYNKKKLECPRPGTLFYRLVQFLPPLFGFENFDRKPKTKAKPNSN